MWEMDHKEGWALKNWCFQTVVLEKTLESPLDCKEIKPVNPKGNESWIFFGRTDAEAETPILWPPGVKNWLTGKIPDAGKEWGKRIKGWQRMRLLDGITDSMDMSLSKLQVMVKDRKPGVLQSTGLQRVGMTEWLNSNIWNYQRSLVWIVCLWIWFKTLLVAHDRHPILTSHGFGRKNFLCSVTKPWKICRLELT